MKTRLSLIAAFLVVGAIHLHAATNTVTSTADSGAGSLRAALASAGNGDTIDASGVTGTILLTSGELLVTNNLTIIGPGPNNLAVDGNAATSVFHIAPSNIVTIASLTITNGSAVGAFPTNRGGGIRNDHATLTVSNCTLSGNSTSGTSGEGGGICNDGEVGSASLLVVNSTLSDNQSTGGGGIANRGAGGSASLRVVNSTFINNFSPGGTGGGILNGGCCGGSASLEIANSTMSGNSGFDGGGIFNGGANGISSAMIVNCTFSGNPSTIRNDDFGFGSASLQIGSTILNGSPFGGTITNQSGTVTSLGYNLSSDSGDGFLTGTTDQINTDPKLGPLRDNGGPTFTHALLCGSPATDQGTNFSAAATDQRDAGFARTFDDPAVPNATGGDGTDIGTFEVQAACPPPPPPCSGGFPQTAGSPVSAGDGPQSVAVGDFNGDGKPDLAVANFNSDKVTIRLGNGNGGFSQPAGSPVSAGNGPNSVVVGDFNGDGTNDLAVANEFSANVTILLGNGSGGFSQPAGSPISVGNGPRSVAVGDFNGDGKPDLAVANEFSNFVTILLGNGSGGFTEAAGSPVSAGFSPRSVAVGDLNGDGKPDLAVANHNSDSVTILLGNGSGGFTEPAGSPISVGNGPRSVAVGDFNGDGKPDLAVANEFSNFVTILLGNGSGGFTEAAGSPVGAGFSPQSVAVGDLNGDGTNDLVVANLNSDDVTIRLGNGSGGFTEPAGSPISVGNGPRSVAVGDFNGDGKPDLAVANFDSDNVTIVRNTCLPSNWIAGDGKWETATNWSSGQPPSVAESADLITNATTKTVTIDATTSGGFSDSLTINNLTVSAPPGSTTTLLLSNAGLATPLDILNSFTISANGMLLVTNSVLSVEGASFNIDGSATNLAGGQIIAMNGIVRIGNTSDGNLTVLGGGLSASHVDVGGGAEGTLTVAGGILVVTEIDVFQGLMTINGGTVTVDFLTSGAAFSFSSGTLNTKSTFVDNGSVAAVGDGASVATLHLVEGFEGVHSFANGLQIRNNAFLTGCGTIEGNMLVDAGGSVLADCGTTLNFSGTFTNNGTVTASNGTVLNFYGPVVNNGVIDATGGAVNFFSTLSGSGSVLTPPPNNWIAGNGKWETAGNWSLGVAPSLADAANLITNAGNKTVTIDATTSGSFPGTLTISNLTVSAPPDSTNTLFLNNAGLATPLDILNNFNISANGMLLVTNSVLRVEGRLFVIDGSVTNLADSQIIATNSTFMRIGNTGRGNFTMLDGSLLASNVVVGTLAGSQGTLTIAGGAITLVDFEIKFAPTLIIGDEANATGTVWITGGQLDVSDGYSIDVGLDGVGQMTVSNGTVLANYMVVGDHFGSQGTVTVAGGQLDVFDGGIDVGLDGVGQMTVSNGMVLVGDGYVSLGSDFGSQGTLTVVGGQLDVSDGELDVGLDGVGQMTVNDGTVLASGGFVAVGFDSVSQGTLTVVGGQLDVTDGELDVGLGGVGQMTVSNGTWLAANVYVGSDAGSQGTLTVAGGTNSFSSFLGVGFFGDATGTVWVTGGQLDVSDGEIDVGSGGIGQMTVSNGTLLVRNGFVAVGFDFDSQGTLTVAGGQLDVTDGDIDVGLDGVGQMTVLNGTVLADQIAVGADVAQGTLTVAGGSLVVTNASDTGELDVLLGLMTINGGTVTVDVLTSFAAFSFNSGTLNTKSTTVNNGSVVAVGDGASVAILHLLGGVHFFANDLRIRNNAFLTGCGTISGNVLVDAGGSVLADCGTTLNFSGTVTNNGTVTASNGTVLNFYGPVVNNGVIDTTGGAVNFFSTLSGSGSVLSPATNSWIAGSGKWENTNNWSLGAAPSLVESADLIANPGNKTVTIDAATSGSFSNSLRINSLVVAAPLNSTNTLLLSDAGTNTPLVVLNSVSVNSGGSMLITNSALQVDGPAGGALTVDGQLTMDSGTILVSSNLLVGPLNPQSLVTIWGGALYVTNAAHDAVTEVRHGTLVLTGGVYLTDSLLITNPDASFLNDGGTFTITGLGQVDQGTQTVASGTTEISSNFVVGSSANSTGTVNVTGGELVVTNGVIGIGNDGTLTSGSGIGKMIVSNGTVLASTILLGSSAGGRGDLVLADGGLIAGIGANCTLVCNDFIQTGGELSWINIGSTFYCGYVHPGLYALSNGTASCQDMYVGYDNAGTMTMAGGTMNILSRLLVGQLGSPVSTGAVWITGGQLTIVDYSIIGNSGVGQMTISNGTVTAASLIVANSGNPGTLSLQGGTLTANLVINPNGRLLFGRGQLQANSTTNANGQTFVIGDGVGSPEMKLTGGTHIFDKGLRVSPKAYLTGCGTISGPVVNLGTITNNCAGGTLSFNGVFTNTATIVAANGSIIDFNGPVVNSGTIIALQGALHFNSTVTNTGTLLSPPVAGFTANPTTGPASLTVTFTDASAGAIANRVWNFGDGGTSTAMNPSHTYTNAGNYSVTLTVFGPTGTNALARPNLIQVTALPRVADIEVLKVGSPEPVFVTGILTYTITVTNHGPNTATSITLTDALPDTVTFVSASDECTNENGLVICDLGSLNSGDATNVTLEVVPTLEGLLTNAASIIAIEEDSNLTNNTATAVTTVTPEPLTPILTVNSLNPDSAVSIEVIPADNDGHGNGNTPFTRTYDNNTLVILTAPATTAGHKFQKWRRDGSDYSVTASVIITMDADHTLTAAYVTLPPPEGTLTSPDGTLSKVKEKCKTKKGVTTCKLSAELALLNAQTTAVSPRHVRFFLSTDTVYDAGVDTQLSDATSKTIRPKKSGKLKLKASLGASASGLFILAVDDSNNALAAFQVP